MRCKACNNRIEWTQYRDGIERFSDPDVCDKCNIFTECALVNDLKDYVHGYTTKNNITITNTSFTDEE